MQQFKNRMLTEKSSKELSLDFFFFFSIYSPSFQKINEIPELQITSVFNMPSAGNLFPLSSGYEKLNKLYFVTIYDIKFFYHTTNFLVL